MVDEEVNHDSSNKTLDEDEEEEVDYNPKKGFGDFLLTPIYWFKMLARETHWSFVAGVVIIYGINQGLGGALSRISTEYYMKDVQKVQPSEAQIYSGITYIPWMVKPLWGLLTDVIPISGFRRRPYFILAGCIGVMSMLSLSLSKSLHLVLALFALTAGSTGVAIADVTIDACIAQNSNTHPAIAADMQSLCALSSSIGALLGFFISGILVHLIGPKGVYGLLVIPFGLVLLVGIVLDEPHLPDFNYKEVNQKFVEAGKAMWTTLKFPDIWRPCLYMYLSIALCFDIAEGMFYWYTDSKGGPNFSQEKVGFVFSIGSVGSLSGAILYQYALKDHKFRDLLFWTQLLYGISGMLDFMLVLRMNLRLGIPDYFFIVIDESVHQFIGRLKWMPLLVLSSQLCPKGIEGTFFALLMSIDNVGILTSSWSGGLLLHVLKVTRTKFDNLWLAILVRNFFRVSPLFLLFLIPRSDPSPAILQAEDLGEKHDIENFEEIDIELVSLIKNDESNKLAE